MEKHECSEKNIKSTKLILSHSLLINNFKPGCSVMDLIQCQENQKSSKFLSVYIKLSAVQE